MSTTTNGSAPNSKEHPPKYDNELVNFLTSLQEYLGHLLGTGAVWLTRTLIFFKRQLILIAIFAALGAAIMVGLNKSKPDFYHSSMVIKSEFLDQDLVEKAVDDLNHAASTSDAMLASLFNATPEEVAPLLRFSCEVRQDSITNLKLPRKPKDAKGNNKPNPDAKTENHLVEALMADLRPDYFYIKAESSDPAVFAKLEKWVVYMLDNNASITRERDLQLAELSRKKEKLDEEMAKLDRLKMIYHEAMDHQKEIKIIKNTPGDVVINQAQIDPLPVYNQYLNYFNEALVTQTQMDALASMVTVMSGFSSGSRGNKPWQADGMLGLLAGLVAGVALSLLIALVRYLNRVERDGMQVEQPEVREAQPVNGRKPTNGHTRKQAEEAAATRVTVDAD